MHFCGRLSDQATIWFLLSPPPRQMLAVFSYYIPKRSAHSNSLRLNYCNSSSLALTTRFTLLIPVHNTTAKITCARFCIPSFASFFSHFFLPYNIKYKHLVFTKAACGPPKLTYLSLLPTLLSLVGFRYQHSLSPCHLSSWAVLCFSAS